MNTGIWNEVNEEKYFDLI